MSNSTEHSEASSPHNSEWPYRCKYYGSPSQVEPSEQTAPTDYCWPEDHMQDKEEEEI